MGFVIRSLGLFGLLLFRIIGCWSGHVNRVECISHLTKTIYNKYRGYIAMHMGKTMKAPFNKHLKRALAMDIAIHDRSLGEKT
jgi:hypothetical protein